MSSDWSVGFMTPAAREGTSALAAQFKFTRAFPNLWTRWGNWEASPPIVAVAGTAVAGFHACTFNRRNPYCNSYYLCVSKGFRGRGVGGALLDFTLGMAARRGNTRLKLSTPCDSEGEAFWSGFGLVPVACSGVELKWDICIAGINSVPGLIDRASRGSRGLVRPESIPALDWAKYARLDSTFEERWGPR